MSSRSKISWTDSTWQTIAGCTKVSTGCQNCYAERMTIRQNGMAAARGDTDNWAKYTDVLKFDYSQNETGRSTGWNGEVYCDSSRLDIPLHWKKPRRIFVNSMSDTFHEKVPFEFIDKIFAVMALCPQHTFQVLTKRPERMAEYFGDATTPIRIDKLKYVIAAGRLSESDAQILNVVWKPEYKPEWPLSNLWAGVTAENQEMADKRIPILLQIPCATRFLSIEPCLSEINIRKYLTNNVDSISDSQRHELGISQVIIGTESGPHRRPCKLEWVKSLVEQATEAGVAVFVKQIEINGKVEKDVTKFPKHLQLRGVSKMTRKEISSDLIPNETSQDELRAMVKRLLDNDGGIYTLNERGLSFLQNMQSWCGEYPPKQAKRIEEIYRGNF